MRAIGSAGTSGWRAAPRLWREMGVVERAFLVLAAAFLVCAALGRPGLQVAVGCLLAPLSIVVAVRLARRLARRTIWRLRNRLLVTYVFIALVPVLLMLTLAGLAVFALTSQTAVYLATSELDRRVESLDNFAEALQDVPLGDGGAVARGILEFYERRFPGVQCAVRDGQLLRLPADSVLEFPGRADRNWRGIAFWDDHFVAAAYRKASGREVAVVAPLNRDYLSRMVPQLGEVNLLELSEETVRKARQQNRGRVVVPPRGDSNGINFVLEGAPVRLRRSAALEKDRLYIPPPINRFDQVIPWASLLPVTLWSETGQTERTLLTVRSRPSAVLGIPFRSRADALQGMFPRLLLLAAVLFLIVEVMALLIGVSLTRTVTGAVHGLYEGTLRVQEGDFSHRIAAKGHDQLAELARSFNDMTRKVQHLLTVAKEKERIEAELAIAREVQAQLYPRTVPKLATMRLTGVCDPARTVSGDYYDYQALPDGKVALVMGDVSGKGISAALLMATLQGSLRTLLQGRRERAAVAPAGSAQEAGPAVAQFVSHINLQLHANTAPEKFATLFLALYDDVSGELDYTNAGHLPPILLRDGVATRLEVTGMVVGAFPFARYEAARVRLQPGDLLVCFTDGITEPENEYGEMFGEDRLTDVVAKNAHRSDQEIVDSVMQSVRAWTGSPELQDDMTLLVARRC